MLFGIKATFHDPATMETFVCVPRLADSAFLSFTTKTCQGALGLPKLASSYRYTVLIFTRGKSSSYPASRGAQFLF